MPQLTQPGCNPPFLPEGAYPSRGGDVAGRLCATLTQGLATLSCCLPCPSTDWVYSNAFPHRSRIANYMSIFSLILNTFLLLSFALLPKEKSHRHYLSTGLTVSVILIAIAFIIPLGTNPDYCHNDITPNNLHTDLSCAFTGAFVEVGAMGAVVWILLRSIWMALRIITNFNRIDLFNKIAIALGVGLPLVFFTISFPVTGVSYRLGNVCIPNNLGALETWFAWLMIFATVSWLIQVYTIFYCIWRFLASSIARRRGSVDPGEISTQDTRTTVDSLKATKKLSVTPTHRKRVAWRKVRNILLLQWRSIVMAFVVVNLTIYFGIVYIQQTAATRAATTTENLSPTDLEWIACLMTNNGNKSACLKGAPGLGLSESRAVGTLILASFVGIFVFLLLVRRSMFIGWWALIQNPRLLFRKASIASQDFVSVGVKRAEQEKNDEVEIARRTSLPSAA